MQEGQKKKKKIDWWTDAKLEQTETLKNCDFPLSNDYSGTHKLLLVPQDKRGTKGEKHSAWK